MTKAPKKDVDARPDAWKRFERAVDVVVKSPPKHRIAKPIGKKGESPAKPKRIARKRSSGE
jgi:hypothetical protein